MTERVVQQEADPPDAGLVPVRIVAVPQHEDRRERERLHVADVFSVDLTRKEAVAVRSALAATGERPDTTLPEVPGGLTEEGEAAVREMLRLTLERLGPPADPAERHRMSETLHEWRYGRPRERTTEPAPTAAEVLAHIEAGGEVRRWDVFEQRWRTDGRLALLEAMQAAVPTTAQFTLCLVGVPVPDPTDDQAGR